jgi:tetratricopeptide (TPR) repeat protein
LLAAAWSLSSAAGQTLAEGDLRRLEELVRQRRYAEAEAPLRVLVAARPSAYGHYLLGFTLTGLYRWPEAEAELRRAVDASPGEHAWRHALAKTLQEQGRNVAAIAELDRAIALEPRPEYFFAKAMCALNAGDLDVAETALRRCLEGEPDHPEALYQLGRLLIDRGVYAASLESLRRCLAVRPAHLEARFRAGLAASQTGDLTAAAADFEAVLAQVPGHVGALYNLGRVLGRLGRTEEARERLAELAAMSRRRDEIDFALAAVARNPTRVDARLAVAAKLLDAGSAEEALEQLLAARRLEPGRAETYRLLARTFTRLGRDEPARQAAAFAGQLEERP